jgi:hypothetical protein
MTPFQKRELRKVNIRLFKLGCALALNSIKIWWYSGWWAPITATIVAFALKEVL